MAVHTLVLCSNTWQTWSLLCTVLPHWILNCPHTISCVLCIVAFIYCAVIIMHHLTISPICVTNGLLYRRKYWQKFYLAVSRRKKQNWYWPFLIWHLQSEHNHYSWIMTHPSNKTMCAFSRTMEMYVMDRCERRHHISKHFWTPTIGAGA